MKKAFLSILCAVLILQMFCISASAFDAPSNSVRICFSDGSYCVQTIVAETNDYCENLAVSSTKTGIKSSRYYNANGVLQFTVSVRGTFSYTGTTATATASQYTYTISDSSWSFVSGRSYCSGVTATASCTFRSSAAVQKALSVSLTCSPTGVLS